MTSAYPVGPVKVLDFKYKNDLHLTRKKGAVRSRKGEDADYVVTHDYCASVLIRKSDDMEPSWFPIKVPRLLLTDLSSVPWWGCWYVGRVGPHLEASVIHDWLFVAWQLEGRKPDEDMRQFADDVLLEALQVARVPCIKRWVIYKASQWGGASLFYEKDCPLFASCLPSTQMSCGAC